MFATATHIPMTATTETTCICGENHHDGLHLPRRLLQRPRQSASLNSGISMLDESSLPVKLQRCNQTPWRLRDGESASTVMDGNCSPSFLHKPRGPCIVVLASPSIRQEALTFPAIAVENATLAEHDLNLSMAHGASGNKSERTRINV
ncbi:hypothetical protein VPH35_072856 [Triticum aestivum]